MKKSSPWKSGVNTFVFSAIADGNLDLVAAYKNLSVEEKSGLKALSPVFVETAVSKAKIDVEEVAALIKRTQNVSICFLLDTTGSMGPYVTGIKDQIVQIVAEVQASNCVIAGLAFVGYKDWCDGDNHFEVLPFTTKITDFKNFVGRVNARGGGDVPEDVIGGLNQALKLQWPEMSGSRILYHMGDAPPHGKERYHRHVDDFPKGHPEDRTLSHLFLEMRAKRVSYYFGRINSECDQMLQVFETHYGTRIEPMDSTKVSTLANRVTACVMKTVTSSCLSTLSTIKTSGCVIRKYHLDLKEPDWSRLPTVGATITTYKLPASVSEITSFSEMEEVVRKCSAQIAPNPFAKGSVRLAYYGRVFHSVIENERSSKDSSSVVFKELITLPKVVDLDRQRYMAALEIQTIASKLATEFNDRLKLSSKDPDIKVQFHVAKVVQFETEDGVIPRYMAYESRFRGSSPIMVKYTNSLDFVLNPGSTDEAVRTRVEVAVAFSHFTHSITHGYLLVCDLQGITTKDKMGKPTLLLTDPAIHCPKHNLRFGRSNLGALGVNKFFAKHKCNSLCLALGLKMPPKHD